MIVVLRLPLNVVTIIPDWIFSTLLSDFRAQEQRSIPTYPITTLTQLIQADAGINIHPLPVSSYFISCSQWLYQCSCIYTMSIFCPATVTVNFGSWSKLFKVLTLSDAMSTVLLHLRNVCLNLRSIADFSNSVARAPTQRNTTLVFPRLGHCSLDTCCKLESY